MNTKLPILRHQTWNAMIETVSRRLPITFTSYGKKWAHPWSIVPSWSAERKEWVLRIKPGFVNGLDPEFDLPVEQTSTRTQDRILNENGFMPEDGRIVAARLTEFPDIPVGGNTRIIGKGANPSDITANHDGIPTFEFEPVPEFFTQMGVTQENVVFSGNLNTGIQVVETPAEDTGPAPILRAVDIELSMDRPSAKLDIVSGDAALDSFTALLVVNYNRSTAARERPYLQITAKYRPQIEVEMGSLLEGAADPEFDAIKVGTVYFLSPPGAAPTDPLDEKWNAFPKHDLFWNLAHAPQRIPDPTPIEPIRLQTGLIGGIADPIFSGLLAPGNDAFNEALQVLRNRNLAGRFWSL
jgi:hypothetical protein